MVLRASDVFDEKSKPTPRMPQDIVSLANAVLRSLVDGGKDITQLAHETGLSKEDVARSLHYLKHSLIPPLVESTEINDRMNNNKITRHHLTADGKRNLPPPRSFDWHSPAVDPRKIDNDTTNVKKLNFVGVKHLHGFNGKVRMMANGEIVLAGQPGMIFEAIKKHAPLSADDIAKKTGIEKPRVWTMLTELVKHDLVAAKIHDSVNIYTLGKSAVIKNGAMTNATRPVSTPTDVSPPPPISVPEFSKVNKAMGERPPEDALAATLQSLIAAGYTPSDIILTLLDDMERELKELRELRNHIVGNLEGN